MIERTEELLLEEMRDLYDAEKQLVKALPKMSRAASDSELEQALRQHLEETRGQVQRLEQAFEMLGVRARSRPCKGMKGIVEEGQDAMQEEARGSLGDSAIVGAGQRVEHYEMGGYANCIALAMSAGQRKIAGLLNQTLEEERKASKTLTGIGKRLLKEAAMGGWEDQGETESGRRGRSTGHSASGISRTKSSGGSSSGRPASSRSSSSRTRSSRGRSTAPSHGRAGTRASITTDHDVIREWAEQRDASPACVRGTGGRGDIGMLRLDFPGYSGQESLQPISWDDWFRKFDERNLALLYQDRTARGQKSNFNKLVARGQAARTGRSGGRASGAA